LIEEKTFYDKFIKDFLSIPKHL